MNVNESDYFKYASGLNHHKCDMKFISFQVLVSLESISLRRVYSLDIKYCNPRRKKMGMTLLLMWNLTSCFTAEVRVTSHIK